MFDSWQNETYAEFHTVAAVAGRECQWVYLKWWNGGQLDRQTIIVLAYILASGRIFNCMQQQKSDAAEPCL